MCRLPSTTTFHLQGICRESYIDRFYVLQPERQLLGYQRSLLAWTGTNWQITNTVTNITEAVLEEANQVTTFNHPFVYILHWRMFPWGLGPGPSQTAVTARSRGADSGC